MSSNKNLSLIITSAAANIGGLIFGLMLAWSALVADEMIENENYRFHVSSNAFGWITGIMALGGTIAPPLAGYSRAVLGTKMTKIFFCIPIIVGQILIIFPANISMLLIGRFLCGISAACFAILCPLYVGEISSNEIRGALLNFFQMNLNTGVTLIFVIGFYFDKLTVNIVCAVIPIMYGIIFFFLPESPTMLINKDQDKEAIKVLKNLHGDNYDYKTEVSNLKAQKELRISNALTFREVLKDPATFRALVIILMLFMFMQMCGINVVLFYSTIIFEAAGVAIDPGLSSIIIALIGLLSTLPTSYILDRFGRRILIISSFALMFFGLTGIGTFFILMDNSVDTSNIEWLPLASLGIFMSAFNFGIAPVTYTLLGEIFIDEAKKFVAPMGVMLNFFLTFILGFTFPIMVDAISLGFSFYIFAFFTFFGLIFSILYIPETKGKSFEEIRNMLK